MSYTDWRALFAFEARYQLRRWNFAALTLALCGLSAVMVRTGYAANGTTVNAPAAVMQSLGLLSLWALFTQTIFTVHGVLRDVEHGMTELVESRPLSRGLLLVVRTAGVAGAGILAFAIATVVLMLGPMLLVSDMARVGPVRLSAYVVPFLTLVVPNLLLVTALVIAVAAIWRSTVATYVGAVGLFAAYMLTALAVSSPIFAGGAPATPESLARAAILDPFGLSAFFEQARYWTIAQRERDLVSLSGRYLINRALWLAVGLAVLGAAVRLLAVPSHRRNPGRRASAPDTARDALPGARRPYHPVTPSTTGFAAALASTWRMELRLLAVSWPIRALVSTERACWRQAVSLRDAPAIPSRSSVHSVWCISPAR
jgi:ABC-2 type transport system permease protein